MNACKRWRYALIISVAVNVFLLCGLGILSAGFFTAQPIEEVIELELVTEEQNQQAIVSSVEQGNISEKTLIKSSNGGTTSKNPAFSSSPVAIQEIPALHIDEVSTSPSTDHDMGETQGASSVGGSGNGGNSSSEQSSDGKGSGGQGSGSSKTGGGIIGPIILSQVYPTYPEDVRQAGIAGTVILKVQILETGRAGEVSVKRSSGHQLLDESAVDAVYKWRFTPAKEKDTGRPVKCYTTVPIVFRLN